MIKRKVSRRKFAYWFFGISSALNLAAMLVFLNDSWEKLLFVFAILSFEGFAFGSVLEIDKFIKHLDEDRRFLRSIQIFGKGRERILSDIIKRQVTPN